MQWQNVHFSPEAREEREDGQRPEERTNEAVAQMFHPFHDSEGDLER